MNRELQESLIRIILSFTRKDKIQWHEENPGVFVCALWLEGSSGKLIKAEVVVGKSGPVLSLIAEEFQIGRGSSAYFWRSGYLKELTDFLLAAIIEQQGRRIKNLQEVQQFIVPLVEQVL